MSRRDSKLVDIEGVIVKHATERAWLFKSPFDNKPDIWVPKLQCEVLFMGVGADRGLATIKLPEDVAQEKGFI